MSKKSKSQRHANAQRKRENRAKYRKNSKDPHHESYFEDDETYPNFSAQLEALGLALREIPGDGNCLFRALADQMDGNSQNHLLYRQDTVDYMMKNREDFEPFIEDNMPFDRYMNLLRKPGTYAGNDAIVAFARRQQCKVVIHQLNAPTYQIIGSEEAFARELHISYHNGDHYASIRRIGDNTPLPANIKFMPSTFQPQSTQFVPLYHQPSVPGACGVSEGKSKDRRGIKSRQLSARVEGGGGATATTIYPDESGEVKAVRDVASVEQYIMTETGSVDGDEVHRALVDNGYDVDNTITYLLQLRSLRSPLATPSTTSSPTSSTTSSTTSSPTSSTTSPAFPGFHNTEDVAGGSDSGGGGASGVGGTGSGAGGSEDAMSLTSEQTTTTGYSEEASSTSTASTPVRCDAAPDTWSHTSSGYSSHSSSLHPSPVSSQTSPYPGGARPKQLSNKQRKEQARAEKKKKQEERHRQRHLQQPRVEGGGIEQQINQSMQCLTI